MNPIRRLQPINQAVNRNKAHLVGILGINHRRIIKPARRMYKNCSEKMFDTHSCLFLQPQRELRCISSASFHFTCRVFIIFRSVYRCASKPIFPPTFAGLALDRARGFRGETKGAPRLDRMNAEEKFREQCARVGYRFFFSCFWRDEIKFLRSNSFYFG